MHPLFLAHTTAVLVHIRAGRLTQRGLMLAVSYGAHETGHEYEVEFHLFPSLSGSCYTGWSG